MEFLLDLLLSLFPIAVGMIVLSALLSHAYRLSGGRWRQLALAYPMPDGRALSAPLIVRWFEMVELFEGDQDAEGQSWWVFAQVYADGLVLSLPPLFPMAYPPIFIPMSDLRVERRRWRSKSDAAAIAAPRAEGLAIIIGDTLARAIAAIRPNARSASA